ncbi:MAG: cell division protein FtsZ [Bacteroidales bacterium]|jgi:cell division protein FtsZ|nr:cell division protein FtsZ [Bacteroidales bacterium]
MAEFKGNFEENINIEWTPKPSSIIKVIGVGGGGGNAVNYMYEQGIHDVDFIVCNTDAQALNNSPIQTKIRLGKGLTEGLGAGSLPEVGRQAAEDSEEEIRKVLDNTKMVFITAGMGGGTGTGAAPVIARIAKEMNILTVAIVTIPFEYELIPRIKQAWEGVNELRQNVDSLLIIKNDKLIEIYGDLDMDEAYAKADNILLIAAKSIAELVTVHGKINVDFADAKRIMKNGGITVMGSAAASGENRARQAVEDALNSPLLNNNDITGAGRVLLNITYGTSKKLKVNELNEITQYVSRLVNKNAHMIHGTGEDKNLDDAVRVTIVATDFPNPNDCFPDIPAIAPRQEKKEVVSISTPPVNPNSGNYEVITRNNMQKQIIWESSDVATEEEKQYVPPLVDPRNNIDDLENTTAISRRKTQTDKATADTDMSRYTLSSDPETNTVRLRDNNPYLYDRVD